MVKRFWAIFSISIKRIFSLPWMSLATLTGMVFATSLSMSVPLYASSVYNRIFLQSVEGTASDRYAPDYPPFSFMFYYDSSAYGNLQWPDLAAINAYIQTQSGAALGLPIRFTSRYFATDPMALFPASVATFPDTQKPLTWSSLALMDNLEQHVTVLEGHFPRYSPAGPIEVLVDEQQANDLGLQVGEQYNLFAREQVVNGATTTVTLPVSIAGIFKATDAAEDYWFIKPGALKERLMVPEETFVQRVSPALSNEIYSAFWFIAADGSRVRPEQAMSVVSRIQRYENSAGQALPKTRLMVSPASALYAYQTSANHLTLLLFAYSIPIFGLLLAFISMTAGMTAERQRNEIAVLRSRGATSWQIAGMAAVESLLMGAVTLLISLPLSAAIVSLIGRTRSFLDFTGPTRLELSWTLTTLYFGLGAILLALLARVAPALSASRDTIVSYKRDRSRSLRAPLWQRMGLDFLLMIPAGYGLYQLRRSGSIDVLGAASKGDPFANPLLLMVPALAIFALALFFLRLMPLAMRAMAWLTARTRSVGLMMATRYLSRDASTYALPLVLLILTLSLSAFTATLAGTLDNHLYDQAYYQVGADAAFSDLGDTPDTGSAPAGGGGGGAASTAGTRPGWYFLPVTDYLKLDGVQDATRVGRYQATAILGKGYQAGDLVGVDRANLPEIAFWRADFAPESLGELMNRLGSTYDGLLVDAAFLSSHALSINDLVTLRVVTYQQTKDVDFHIVGVFNLFPTFYPGERPLFISNLDYLFESLGAEYPYSVWLKTAGPLDLKQTEVASFTRLGARTAAWSQAVAQITGEQARPERQGLFGVLSVGFGAAALLTVVGFLLYALLSYQRRFVELGILRAVGLSTWQMVVLLASELAFLILMGGIIGTVLGVWVSQNFIPYLQIGAGAAAQIPPYVVYVAWPEISRVYALFGLLFVVALVTLVFLLRRMHIFEAIKMGETT
mgnify:CR=1 FL=1